MQPITSKVTDWHRWSLGTEGGPVCAVGGLWMAFQGNIPAIGNWNTGRSIDEAYGHLSHHVSKIGHYCLATWNDAEGRTKEEVAATLRAVANS